MQIFYRPATQLELALKIRLQIQNASEQEKEIYFEMYCRMIMSIINQPDYPLMILYRHPNILQRYKQNQNTVL